MLGTCLDEGPIEGVAVEGRDDGRARLADVREEAMQEGQFVRLVEDDKGPFVLGLGRILKVGDILAHDLAIRDEISLIGIFVNKNEQWPFGMAHLAVNHVRNHHDHVALRVGELERLLRTFYVKGCFDTFGQWCPRVGEQKNAHREPPVPHARRGLLAVQWSRVLPWLARCTSARRVGLPKSDSQWGTARSGNSSEGRTFVYGDAQIVWNVILAHIEKVVLNLEVGRLPAQIMTRYFAFGS